MTTLPEQYQLAFKDADIRGRYPAEINECSVYRIGAYLVQQHGVAVVLVARDMRVSSPALHQALVQGIRDAGADVHDLGMVPTPVLYHASGESDAWGVMITASHNPADYNGLKIVLPGAVPMTAATGLRDLEQAIELPFSPVADRGKRVDRSVWSSYLKKGKTVVPLPKQSDIRVVIDVGNGMSAVLLERAMAMLPGKITVLNGTLDGTFPVRGSNPMLRKNQRPIQEAMRTGRYDLGMACDGDGDRIAFFDATGAMHNSAAIGALLAQHLLAQNPGAAMVYTVFTSKVYEEAITDAGGAAKKARVGHAFIKETMRQHDAIFACEHSGHFYFRDNYYADSVWLALRYVLAAMIESQASLRELLQPYRYYTQTEEILLRVQNKKAVLRSLAEQHRSTAERVVRYDGVSVYYPEYWFVVKPSVTEDALKFVVEAPLAKTARAAQKALRQQLNELNKATN